MRISRIGINNYRGIREANIDFSPFACIVGENNAGKSSILLALSLFFSGSKLSSSSEFYDDTSPIEIEVEFEGITETDLNRIPKDHRERMLELIHNEKLILIRKYATDFSPELLCKRPMPKDERFDMGHITEILKGKRGAGIEETISGYLPEYSERFEGITTQKAAKEAVESIINELPFEELELKSAALPTGIPNSIKAFLPEPILIPAVKDVTDEVKTKEAATLGKLLSILLKVVENAEEMQEVINSFDRLKALLNKSEDEAGSTVDNRLPQIKAIEELIKSYLHESFPQADLELQVPPPELKQVFSTTRVLIDDGVKDIVETKGDGIKRSVTFALLRSYVDMKIQYQNTGTETPAVTPYIFLFEEPELYLHPSAQRVLFDALYKISIDNQVVVTTHSPLFFSPVAIGTFVKVIKKYPHVGKPYGHAITVDLIRNLSAKDAFQIICYENNSAAFFAKKVVLIEGDSDLIYIKHLAKISNEEWDFDKNNIPLVIINGKGNVKRYKQFFEGFEIEVHVILDLDAILDNFDIIDVDSEITQLRQALFEVIDGIAETEGMQGDLNKNKIKEMIRGYTWKEKYTRFKELALEVAAGKQITQEESKEIELLLSKEVDEKRKEVLGKNDVKIDHKDDLLAALRNKYIYILSKGAIEEYYPEGVTGDDKPTKALNACDLIQTKEQIEDLCPEVTLSGEAMSEFEAIFKTIFE
ncbi:MAG: DUF2813 domain-containing protein [Firmicutes bacterium]|nr:DUF2813 domain-containing protein [Bacillota bacterium]